jgi:hypothetical protein
MYPAFFSDGLYQPEVVCHPRNPDVSLTTRSTQNLVGFERMGKQRSSELQRRPLVGCLPAPAFFTSIATEITKDRTRVKGLPWASPLVASWRS